MKAKRVYVTAGLLLLLASYVSGAIAADSYAMPTGEAAVNNVLTPIFGGILGGDASGGGALGSLFGKLNAAILLIGGLLTGYGILAGTAQTAHDGEMLGRQWSSLWVPIRLALGVAMIVPTPTGYCGAQMMVAFIGQQGVAAASGAWADFAKSDLMPKPAAYTPTDVPGVRALALGLLDAAVCARAYDRLAQQAEADTNPSGYDGERIGTTEIEPGHFVYGTSQSGVAICGGYALNQAALQADESGVGSVHATATGRLTARMAALAATLSDLTVPIDQTATNAEIAAAVKEYENTIKAAATASVAAVTAVRTATAQSGSVGGWIMTGAYYNTNRTAVSSAAAGVAATPAATKGNLAGVNPIAKDAVAAVMARADAATGGANDLLKGPSIWDRIKGAGSKLADVGSQVLAGDVGPGMLFSYIGQAFTNFVKTLADVRNAQGDALDNLHQLGEAAMAASIVGFGLAVGIGILSTTGGLILAGISTALFSFGAVNGVYLPMVPTILWMAAVIGWFTLFLECMVAAPIWALMHLQMDGNGIAGRGASGYGIILSLALRPILMTIGFAAAMGSATPLIKIFNTMFFAAVANNFDDPNGILLQIAMFCVYVVAMVAIVHKLFALIHIIPEIVMRWIGGAGGDSHGSSSAEHIGRQTHAGMTGALGGIAGAAAINSAQRGMSDGAGNAGAWMKDKLTGNGGKGEAGDNIINSRQPPAGDSGGINIDAFNADTDQATKDMHSGGNTGGGEAPTATTTDLAGDAGAATARTALDGSNDGPNPAPAPSAGGQAPTAVSKDSGPASGATASLPISAAAANQEGMTPARTSAPDLGGTIKTQATQALVAKGVSAETAAVVVTETAIAAEVVII